ncbi:MAG: cation:proton antiporter [Gemmatimonadales bacterium]|nr:cation:proton antiporter [Gemmatimonadales bacterium]
MQLFLASLAPEGADIASLFLMLAALVTAAKCGGAVAVRFGQPAVLGELLAGIVVGPGMLALADPTDPTIHVMSEFGVVILLFQIGLHTDLRALFKVGSAASAVGVVGVALPFGFGYLAATMMGLASLPAILCGAAMTATSIGISARVLGDIGVLDSREGRTVLGAAVLDDVIGLIILAVTATVASGVEITPFEIAKTAGAAFGFLVVALVAGELLAPRLFALIDRLPVGGTTGTLALAFALALAAAADRGGSALIIGSFAAGLILHKTPQRDTIENSTTVLGYFFVPVFFASVGASVDIQALADPAALWLGLALLVIGIITKFVSGYVPFWIPLRYALVGAAMVPRGEVGLIFAQMGLTSGVISPSVFGALMIMVIGTTLVTPPWLGWLVSRGTPPGNPQDIGGMDDLVSGERRP